jgi:hypothetical protein
MTSSSLRPTIVLERGDEMRSTHSRTMLLRKPRGDASSGKPASSLLRVGELRRTAGAPAERAT